MYHFSRDHHSSEESRLVQFLMKKYRQSGVIARPVINSSETLVVEFALALIQILDFDETNQVLTTNVWKRYVSLQYHFDVIINGRKVMLLTFKKD